MITQTARKIPIFALTITMLAMGSACSSNAVSKPDQRLNREPVPIAQHQNTGERAAEIALSQVGVPYRYGGSTASGFDCSGLVQYSYQRAGKNVPRTTGQLWSSTSTIQRNELQAGDLLFFSFEGKMSHVGMYVGGGRFVHAPSSGKQVSVAKLGSSFYSAAFVRAGRPE